MKISKLGFSRYLYSLSDTKLSNICKKYTLYKRVSWNWFALVFNSYTWIVYLKPIYLKQWNVQLMTEPNKTFKHLRLLTLASSLRNKAVKISFWPRINSIFLPLKIRVIKMGSGSRQNFSRRAYTCRCFWPRGEPLFRISSVFLSNAFLFDIFFFFGEKTKPFNFTVQPSLQDSEIVLNYVWKEWKWLMIIAFMLVFSGLS